MKPGPKPKPVAEKLSKWELGGPNGDCWEWQGTIGANGYGYLYHNGKTVTAHRLSFKHHNPGVFIVGLDVRHSCDNRRCINPEHLSVGTRKDNMADAIERDRLPRGGARWNSKLTSGQVMQIKMILANGKLTQQEIADQFKVSRGCVSKIKRGLSWKDHSQSQTKPPQNKQDV